MPPKCTQIPSLNLSLPVCCEVLSLSLTQSLLTSDTRLSKVSCTSSSLRMHTSLAIALVYSLQLCRCNAQQISFTRLALSVRPCSICTESFMLSLFHPFLRAFLLPPPPLFRSLFIWIPLLHCIPCSYTLSHAACGAGSADRNQYSDHPGTPDAGLFPRVCCPGTGMMIKATAAQVDRGNGRHAALNILKHRHKQTLCALTYMSVPPSLISAYMRAQTRTNKMSRGREERWYAEGWKISRNSTNLAVGRERGASRTSYSWGQERAHVCTYASTQNFISRVINFSELKMN